MKRVKIYTAILAILVLASCGGGLGSGPVFESADGMFSLIEQLEDNYGKKPAFNSILVVYNEQIGNSVIVQGNGDINSNLLTEKHFINGMWQDKAEITMEIEDGVMSDFLFTLDEVDLNKVPGLVKDAKEKVKNEKKIDDVKATSVNITMPRRVSDKMKDLNYTVSVEPKNGGTSFSVSYDLSGNYINIVY